MGSGGEGASLGTEEEEMHGRDRDAFTALLVDVDNARSQIFWVDFGWKKSRKREREKMLDNCNGSGWVTVKRKNREREEERDDQQEKCEKEMTDEGAKDREYKSNGTQ